MGFNGSLTLRITFVILKRTNIKRTEMNKVTRNKNRDFTIISNVFLRDKELSIKAKGFLSVVMGLPDDWDFTINGICETIKEGKTAIYNVIKELKELGYCEVNVCRGEKGIIIGNDYTFYEEPLAKNQHKEEPHPENPHADNNAQLNTNRTNNENKEECNSEDKKEWRNSFELYLALVNNAKEKVLNDIQYRQYMERYYPNIDYVATVNKLIDGFWGSKEGWEYNKAKRKGKTINMVSTLKKNMDKRERIVYKQTNKSRTSTNQKPSIMLNKDLKVVDEYGNLNDGTFLKNGYRYYFSKIANGVVSIPTIAEPKPEGNNFEYDMKLGWYEYE